MAVRGLDQRRLGAWLLNAVAGLTLAFILTPLFFVTWLSLFSLKFAPRFAQFSLESRIDAGCGLFFACCNVGM